MAKIGDVCASKIDTLNAAYNGKIDYIDISAIDNDKKKITNTETLQIKDAPSRARQLVECDDIIVSLVRPNLNAVAVVENSSENLQVASTGYCVLRCNQAVYSRYLFYFCQSETFINRMTAQATGASYPAVSNSIVKNCEIPLPERNKQKEIADILDKATSLISLRKQQLEKLDDLVKARFVEMFENVTEENALENLCHFIDYRGKTPEKSDSGLPFITAKNIRMHYMSFNTQEFISKENYDKVMTRGIPKVGDVVFTTEAPLGNVCRIPQFDSDFYIGQRIITMQTKLLNPVYLEYALSSDDFKRKLVGKSSGSTVTGIRSKLLGKLTIPVPSKGLQNQFAAFVERVDQQKQTVQQSLEKLELMKKALMQEYFG